MVFSSMPAYLDPPNWQQQPNQVQHHQANGSESSQLLSESSQLLPPLPLQPQAQQAKIQPPETALKCPRCESTNTKFCYFNNYSLSQPRHFCKTCRRYWTRGGALRSVPVGGGYRRNKKSKKTTRSESPVLSNEKESSLSNSTSAIFTPHMGQFPQPTNGPNYMTSLQNLSRYGVGNNIGLNNLREIQAQTGNMGFQIGVQGSTAGEGGFFQQFPFLNGFESTTSAVSYPFQSEIVEAPTSRVTQNPSVKMEYNGGGLNLSRSSPLDISENNHYNSWGGTDLSAFASSSASHLL